MRDDPYPCRYYPRLMEEPELDDNGVSVVALPALSRDLRRMFSFLLATYLLLAALFALTTQANAAPVGSDAAAPTALHMAEEPCGHMGTLALR